MKCTYQLGQVILWYLYFISHIVHSFISFVKQGTYIIYHSTCHWDRKNWSTFNFILLAWNFGSLPLLGRRKTPWTTASFIQILVSFCWNHSWMICIVWGRSKRRELLLFRCNLSRRERKLSFWSVTGRRVFLLCKDSIGKITDCLLLLKSQKGRTMLN